MSRGPDAATLLERALVANATQAGCAVAIDAPPPKPWASATFAGARHPLTLSAAASPALDAWLAGLPEAELALPGHLVVELVVEAVRREGAAVTVKIEALTVESVRPGVRDCAA